MKRMQEEKIFNQIKDDVNDLKDKKLYRVSVSLLDKDEMDNDVIIGWCQLLIYASSEDEAQNIALNSRTKGCVGLYNNESLIEICLDEDALEYKSIENNDVYYPLVIEDFEIVSITEV